VLVIQEIFGVGPYIRDVGERLAGLGYLAGAPDVFWRLQKNYEAAHDESGMNESFGMVQRLDFPQATLDCVAALDHLSGMTGAPAAVLGFCMGGTLAWGVAAAGEPAACVSYYGSGVPDMIGMIDEVTCPTLFHFGNADPFIPNEGVERVNAAIAGRANFVLNVENAGHAFDNHEAPSFYDEAASRAAWAKTVAFLDEHLPLR
jgi:carboxymethylenebutenolidase